MSETEEAFPEGAFCPIRRRNISYDHSDPRYHAYIREGIAYTERIAHESALMCVDIALHGPESNQTDPAKITELVASTMILDVLNLRWGSRQLLLKMLMQNVIDSLPKPERRGERARERGKR